MYLEGVGGKKGEEKGDKKNYLPLPPTHKKKEENSDAFFSP